MTITQKVQRISRVVLTVTHENTLLLGRTQVTVNKRNTIASKRSLLNVGPFNLARFDWPNLR